jgi:hypothetical protein
LEIDDAYASWYKKRFNQDLDRKRFVIPLLKALQGHPEAGALWEGLINKILLTDLGFKTTTHERSLYRGEIDGHPVFVCRQVDDYAIATEHQATAEKLISIINSYVTTDSLGIGTRYNGIDILQTRH